MNSFLYFSFAQGVLAFFAPCAVALLPSYILSFISKYNSENTKSNLLLKGIKLTSFSILGILLIYTIAAILIFLSAELIKEYMKYVAVVLGVVLIVMGVLMLMGKEFSLNLHVNQKEFKSEIKESFFFGVAYAIGALGCLFPLFLIVVTGAISQPDIFLGVAYIVAYFLGIALLMSIVVFGSIFAKDFINRKIRAILPYIHKVSSIFLIVAGIYIINYQSALF